MKNKLSLFLFLFTVVLPVSAYEHGDEMEYPAGEQDEGYTLRSPVDLEDPELEPRIEIYDPLIHGWGVHDMPIQFDDKQQETDDEGEEEIYPGTRAKYIYRGRRTLN